MQSVSNKMAVIEIGLKHRDNGDRVILEVYLIKGTLNVGDTIEWQNEVAEVSKYDENSDYYSLSCNANGVFANALGNIITVIVKE